MVGIADTPDSNFEQAYLEVRNLMEKHDHWLIQLQLTDDYLGAAAEDVHFREKPIWEGFVPEPGVHYSMGPPTDWETVSVAVEERVISFSECNKSWLTLRQWYNCWMMNDQEISKILRCSLSYQLLRPLRCTGGGCFFIPMISILGISAYPER